MQKHDYAVRVAIFVLGIAALVGVASIGTRAVAAPADCRGPLCAVKSSPVWGDGSDPMPICRKIKRCL